MYSLALVERNEWDCKKRYSLYFVQKCIRSIKYTLAVTCSQRLAITMSKAIQEKKESRVCGTLVQLAVNISCGYILRG